MKKNDIKKWFGKRQLVTSILILVLAGAIYVNWRYSEIAMTGKAGVSSEQALKSGKAEYVATNKVSIDTTYFDNARNERESSYKDAIAQLEALEKENKASEDDKSKAYESHIALVNQHEKQSNAESLIKAKGFKECVVIPGETEVNVVVKAEELAGSEILQIQDAIQSIFNVELENIKIIHIK